MKAGQTLRCARRGLATRKVVKSTKVAVVQLTCGTIARSRAGYGKTKMIGKLARGNNATERNHLVPTKLTKVAAVGAVHCSIGPKYSERLLYHIIASCANTQQILAPSW